MAIKSAKTLRDNIRRANDAYPTAEEAAVGLRRLGQALSGREEMPENNPDMSKPETILAFPEWRPGLSMMAHFVGENDLLYAVDEYGVVWTPIKAEEGWFRMRG